MSRDLRVLLVVLAVVTAACGSPVPAPAPPPAADFEQQFESAWVQQPRVDLGIAPAGAKVVVVKFIDWMCPACKGQHQDYKPVFERFAASNPGAVRQVMKDWLWNATCNPYVTQTFQGHEASCAAAVAMHIASTKNQGDAMADWLFENQQVLITYGQSGQLTKAVDLIKGQLKTLAGAVDYDGLYPSVIEQIRRDEADGSALNVYSTPTYFVNGVRTTSPRVGEDPGGRNLPPNTFEIAIRIELKKNGGA